MIIAWNKNLPQKPNYFLRAYIQISLNLIFTPNVFYRVIYKIENLNLKEEIWHSTDILNFDVKKRIISDHNHLGVFQIAFSTLLGCT